MASSTTLTPESSFSSQPKQQPSQAQPPPPPASNNNDNSNSNDSQDLDSDLDPPPEINHNMIYDVDTGSEGLQAQSQPTQDGSPQSKKKQMMQKDLGPLLPDHFREALRRYKKEREGAGIGFGGTSVGLGVQGTVAAGRWKGRRLLS